MLLCAATGGGKSAAYQMTAYAAPGTITVVVQPLVELIREQTVRSSAELATLADAGWRRGHARCGRHAGRAREAAISSSSSSADDVAPPGGDDVAPPGGPEPTDTPALRAGTLAHAVVHDDELCMIYGGVK